MWHQNKVAYVNTIDRARMNAKHLKAGVALPNHIIPGQTDLRLHFIAYRVQKGRVTVLEQGDVSDAFLVPGAIDDPLDFVRQSFEQ